MGDIDVDLAGEQVRLMPERALFWPGQATLVAADLHWGKTSAFRAAGVPLPAGTTRADLARLSSALDRTGAARLVLLGDLFHARTGLVDHTLAEISAWRSAYPLLDVLLVRGNHDRRAGDPPPGLGFTVVDGPWPLGPFRLRHEPAIDRHGYVHAGHIHPGCTLHGPGRQRLRLPCFVFGASVGLLPAFTEFSGTGDADRDPRGGDRVYVVAGGEVIAA